MKTTEIHFEIPENILDALNQTMGEFVQKSRLYTALQFFKNHKLSFGKAAELAGISRDDFLAELNKHKIDFIAYDPSELETELGRFDLPQTSQRNK